MENLTRNVVIEPLDFFNQHRLAMRYLNNLEINLKLNGHDIACKNLDEIRKYIESLETQILGG